MIYIVLFLFFISGACGLTYEVVWSRDLVVVMGGATHAVSTVVAAFMGGLGFGSLWGGRAIDRSRRNPVVVYGFLEGGIAVCALLVPALIRIARPLLAVAYARLGHHSWLFDLVSFIVSAAILFPPTLLMGATLPVLVRATLSQRERFGFTAGRLYTINTLGAMAGAGAAGFALLPALGNRLTASVAVGLNLFIFLVVILLRRRFPVSGLGAPRERRERTKKWSLAGWLVLVGYGVSGMAALIYQIAWTRSLTLALGSSTYSFSLILLAYIGGLGLGGALILKWVDRIGRPLFWAGVMEFGIGIFAIAVLPVLDNINLSMYRWAWEFRDRAHLLSLVRFGMTFGIIAAPTMVMGALLPLVARVMARERPGAGEPMGWVYSSNTAGAVGGTFLAGFVLLNLIGVRQTVVLATFLSLAAGLVWTMAGELPKRPAFLTAALGLTAGLALISSLPRPDPLVLSSGPYIYADSVMRQLSPGKTVKQALHDRYRTLFYGEDAEATVLVAENSLGLQRSLRINGKIDASSEGDMPNQLLLAHLPLLLHPRPRSVMVIGLASGVTAGNALLHPIESLDCLELSPAVVQASHYFESVSHLNYSDPRFNLIVADGRNHLELSPKKYDVIISEPSNPWQAGEGLLFTREFFQLARKRLNPGGIMEAWIDVYNMDAANLSLFLRTFADVFPHVTLWETGLQADYVLLGTNEPLMIDYQDLKHRRDDPRIAAALDPIQADALGILTRFVMDERVIHEIVGTGPLHTDDRRQLEFDMPKSAFSLYVERLPGLINKIFSHHVDAGRMIKPPEGEAGKILLAELKQADRMRDQIMDFELARFSSGSDEKEVIARTLALIAATGGRYPCLAVSKDLAAYLSTYAGKLHNSGDDQAAEAILAQSFELDPNRGLPAAAIANYRLNTGDLAGARQWAEKAVKSFTTNLPAYDVLARVARKRGEQEKEELYRRKALAIWPQSVNNRIALARVLDERNQEAEAYALLRGVLADDPDNADAHFFLGIVLYKARQWDPAERHFKKALALDPGHPSAALIKKTLKELEQKRGRGE
ncbi:MAG TPA: fused MFS/spermidine synthase [bacterium]|nr:fused MFS/spermidine synthase [bacterium]